MWGAGAPGVAAHSVQGQKPGAPGGQGQRWPVARASRQMQSQPTVGGRRREGKEGSEASGRFKLRRGQACVPEGK